MKHFNKDEFGNLRADETLQQILDTYNVGDGLSDVELDTLLEFYTRLEGMTTVLGPKYQLFTSNVRRHLDTLRGFKHARQVPSYSN